jgi:5-methylcytosine-specific restriction endonuclease McrA
MLQTEAQPDFSQQVLRTDVAGMPLEWVDYRDAVRLYHTDQVAYACGSLLYRVRGGFNALSGDRSIVDVNSIIATVGKSPGGPELRDRYIPPLNNKTLFRRDGSLCLYCGCHFMSRDLTRDHVQPVSQGGTDEWRNVVTACRRCNNHKGGRTPEQSGMELIAVPFTPTYAEYIYLKGRRVLADQMEFLLAHISRTSPLRSRLEISLQEGVGRHRDIHSS